MSDMPQPDFQASVASMAPEKLAFLMELMEELQGKSMEEALPLLISANARAAREGISFSPQETELLITCFSAQLSPEEQKRLVYLRNMLQMYQQGEQ